MSIHHVERAALTDMPASKKLVFMAICDSADKETRVAAPGFDALRQWSGLGQSQIYDILNELIAEGYLRRLSQGRKGHRAEWLVFAAVACCSMHDPVEGSGSPEPKTGSAPPEAKRKASGKGSGEGSGPDRTPSPPTHLPSEPDGSAQVLIGEWIDHCSGRPPSRVIGQVSKEVKALLDEGIPYDDVRGGLAAWNQKRLHPSTIPSVVHEVRNNPRRAEDYEHNDRPARVLSPDEWERTGTHG